MRRSVMWRKGRDVPHAGKGKASGRLLPISLRPAREAVKRAPDLAAAAE